MAPQPSFLLRRLSQSAIVLLAVSMCAFGLAELAPGDPFTAEQLDSSFSEATFERLRQRAGLEDPLPIRYGRWLASVARGELGISIAHGRPVVDLLLPRLAATLTLTVLASTAAWLLALGLGAWGARRPDGLIDRAGMSLVSTLQATPELLLALLAAALALRLGLPVSGMASLDADSYGTVGRLVDRLRHLFLPVSVLTLASLPPLLRHTRAAMEEAFHSSHVLAARARGLSEQRVFLGYVLPLAANPLISLFGISFGALVSGSLVVEVVLGWPGVGPLMLEAVFARDLHVIVAGTLCAGAFLLAGNTVADLALHRLDPRLESQLEHEPGAGAAR